MGTLESTMGDEEEVPVEWPPLWDANANDQVEIEESEEQASVKEALNAARVELEKANQAVLAMRNKIAELKTYKVEPKCAEVIHAAFALLGTDPKEVAEWNELRRRLTPEFFNSLTSFNDTTNAPSRKNERAAARLVEALDEETVKQSSEALLALYNWVTAGRKLLTEASQLRATLTELVGKVPEDLTGDLYLDYEAMCTTLDLAPHPHLLPRKQCKKQRIADAPEVDPKAKGAPEGIAEELQCHSLTVSGLRVDYGSMVSLARCLPSCTTCCKIELWNTNLNDATVAALATVLPATAVTHLSLDWSLTIAEMMAANSTLTVLDLSNNRYYLDCVNWIEKKRAAPKEGPALRGSSLQAHIIEEYLVALVTLIDKERALPVPAEPEEEEEPAAEETEEAPAE